MVVKLEGGSDEDVELLRHQKVEDECLAEIGEKDTTETTEVEATDNENGEILRNTHALCDICRVFEF